MSCSDGYTSSTTVTMRYACIPERYQQLVDLRNRFPEAYWHIFAAKDVQSNNKDVFLKTIFPKSSSKQELKNLTRNLQIQRHLRTYNSKNFVNIVNISAPLLDSDSSFVIVKELMPSNLYRVWRAEQTFALSDVKYFMYHVLRAVRRLHSALIVHHSLHPDHVLLNEQFDVKLCKFSGAKSIGDQEAWEELVDLEALYVPMRRYRAPEVLLMWDQRTMASDVWSCGIMMIEMLRPVPRKRLFSTDNVLRLVEEIFETFGAPETSELRMSTGAKKFFHTLPRTPKRDLATIAPLADATALDLLQRMVEFNPEKRITASEALMHPFFADLRQEEEEDDDEEAEEEEEVEIPPFVQYEDVNITEEQAVQELLAEVAEWRKLLL